MLSQARQYTSQFWVNMTTHSRGTFTIGTYWLCR